MGDDIEILKGEVVLIEEKPNTFFEEFLKSFRKEICEATGIPEEELFKKPNWEMGNSKDLPSIDPIKKEKG